MKRLLLVASLLSYSLYAQVGDNTRAKPTDWEEINFEFNQSVLVDGFPSLLRLADLLKQHPDYKVNLAGHADQTGSNAFNDALSLRRANAVAQFLQKYGASSNQIAVAGDGKRNPEAPQGNANARFVNRRVVITVTAPNGTLIGDGSITAAINDFETYTRGQLGKIDGILAQLQALEGQVRALQGDAGAVRQDTGQIKQDTTAIRQDTGALTQRPAPLTADQTTQIANTAANTAADNALAQAALRNKKYAQVGVDAGPTFADGRTGNYSTDLFGDLLLPFGNGKTPDQPGTHGIQMDADWVYFHKRPTGPDLGLSDAIFDVGLLNRFNHFQAGGFAQFDLATFNAYQGGGFLGAGILTLDYIFRGGRIGIFGAKGFVEESNVGSTATTLSVIPAYIRYDDQAGFDAAGQLWGKFSIESNFAVKQRWTKGLGKIPSSEIKVIYSATDFVQFFIEADQNTTFQNTLSGDRVVFGVTFGDWMRPTAYGSTTGVVPVDLPRPHYELLAR